MGYIATGFTPDEEKLLLDRTQRLVTTSDKIVAMNAAEESRRRWTLALGVVGAVFAAVKLGIVAFPLIKQRRRALGDL
jgi:uncharacterized membrane protein